jgi:branched-chain amino acid transport system permease protein
MTTFLQQLVNGISLGSIYALIALGYTMVYGVLRLINFAHGDVYMLGAYVGYYLSRRLKGDEPSLVGALLVMLGAMLACAVLGVIIERFAYRPVRRAAKLTLLITAIGVSLFIENAAQLVFGPDPKFFPSLAPRADFLVAGVRLTSEQLTVIAVSFILMIMLRFFILKTRTGKAMRAVSFNLDTAKLMGISTDRIIATTFALGSALAGAAGVLIGMQIKRIDPLRGILSGL